MRKWIYLLCLYGVFVPVQAAKLAIVIDDYGYRLKNEQALLRLSPKITVAVLPDSPNGVKIARQAQEKGHDVIVHLPMAPLSKQPLEKKTIMLDMSQQNINHIVQQAVDKFPMAIGLNNHMGSAITADFAVMQKVFNAVYHSNPNYFFLDSLTVANSQVKAAAKKTETTVLQRDVFLDDKIEIGAIRHQFQQAIKQARRKGYAIVIGHPHLQTVQVLRESLATLPEDIHLVKLSELLLMNKKTEPEVLPAPTVVELEPQKMILTKEQKIQNMLQILTTRE